MLMKTIFKKGMKVYDQLIFPDKEGIVLTTNYIPEKFFDEDDFDENYVHPYPIEVEFGSEIMLYTSDGDSGMCGVKTLSIKPYRVVFEGFEQKAPAPTFEEAWNNSHNSKEIFYSSNCDKVCSGYPTQELADASEALRRLLFLRDYYNEGWQPNWKKEREMKYVIYNDRNKLATIQSYTMSFILAFKEGNIRSKFLEDQRELLEIAKPLL